MSGMKPIGNNFELPKEKNELMSLVKMGQHVKGFVVYCQLITDKITDHSFCDNCPFHKLHMAAHIPIICTSHENFIYWRDGKKIKLEAKGVSIKEQIVMEKE